jgi:tetratricopeptide (TPR) repeat protein
MKNYKILIIACLVLLVAIIIGGGFWYFNKNTDNNKGKQEISFNTGFVLLDDESSLAWSEVVQLDPGIRVQFEKKVSDIKADLAVATDKEQILADYNNLALFQKYLGNYRESYSAYLESLKIESQARVTWQNFADVLLKMRAFKSAEMAYKKAVELNKYIPESYVKLADYYKAVSDVNNVEATYKLAIETIKQSMESDTLVLDAYAEWLGEQKRYDEAITVYEELIVKQPDNKAAIERKINNLKNKK